MSLALAGEMPAVELQVWQRSFICGNGLGTWDPDPSPMNGWISHPIAVNLAIERIRRAHDYGIRHRVGEAP